MFEPGPGIPVPPYVTFEDLDAALEWAEDLVLEREGDDGDRDERVELRDHPFLAGLEDSDQQVVVDLLEPRRYEAGDLVMQAGTPADEMFLLTEGRVSSLVPRADGTSRRLASFGGGSLVGELALLGNEPRMVDVRADTDLECHALTVDAIVALGALRPEARITLFANMLWIVSSLADTLRDELALLGE